MKKPGASILVVDDEREILSALQRSLVAHGYRVQTATNGADALATIARYHPDLLLLDLLMPGMSGLEVCRQIRATSALPIIILSVKDAERDKVEALDLGADDYVAKPFGMNEVLARVRVALRHLARMSQDVEPHLQAGPLSIDAGLRRVELNGQELALTPTEYDLLKLFVLYRNKILTRKMLVQRLWGEDKQDRDHSLHVYVARLRQRIEPVPERPRFIFTIPGVGYRFQDEPLDAPSPDG